MIRLRMILIWKLFMSPNSLLSFWLALGKLLIDSFFHQIKTVNRLENTESALIDTCFFYSQLIFLTNKE